MDDRRARSPADGQRRKSMTPLTKAQYQALEAYAPEFIAYFDRETAGFDWAQYILEVSDNISATRKRRQKLKRKAAAEEEEEEQEEAEFDELVADDEE